MTRKMSALLVALFLVMWACGDDEVGVATPGAGGDDTSEPTSSEADEFPTPVCLGPGEELPEYRGISVDQANQLAEDEGLAVREVGRDGECFAVTDDLRDDRVNIEVVADMVIAAAIY